MPAEARAGHDAPSLGCEGEVQAEGPAGLVVLAGVADGIEVRLESLRQAWSLRRSLDTLTLIEPLNALPRWWRLSGVSLHLVVAGRRIATAEPAGHVGRVSWWMPGPWRPKPGAVIAAVLAAAIGRG
ncbi:MAG: hypothetical protein AAGB29_07515 [Planctomycetota bacterium]